MIQAMESVGLLLLIVLWLWAFVDCVYWEDPRGRRLTWALVLILLNVFGLAAYLCVPRHLKRMWEGVTGWYRATQQTGAEGAPESKEG